MMHTDYLFGANPVVAELVQRLLAEDCRFDAMERRSAIREHLVRPVTIRLRDSNAEFPGFSRNISSNGICIITQDKVEERSFASIRIHRLEGEDVTILAECRWTKPFGASFYMSGWQFLGVGRNS
ncbi:MAG TPA: PilZ domain-containing protein [Pirellulaceae bacterium]|nr:PilZ domain-containing protein [Pirellulaceae bacterium]